MVPRDMSDAAVRAMMRKPKVSPRLRIWFLFAVAIVVFMLTAAPKSH